eukprot:g9301.t1
MYRYNGQVVQKKSLHGFLTTFPAGRWCPAGSRLDRRKNLKGDFYTKGIVWIRTYAPHSRRIFTHKNAGDAEKVKVCMSRAWRKHKAKLTKAQVNKPVSAGDTTEILKLQLANHRQPRIVSEDIGVHGSAHDDCLSGIEEHPDDNIHMEQLHNIYAYVQGKESPAVASTIKIEVEKPSSAQTKHSEEVKETKVMPVVAPTVKSEEVKEAKVMPVVAPTVKIEVEEPSPVKQKNLLSAVEFGEHALKSNLDNLEYTHGKFKRRNDDSDIEYETPPYKRAAVEGGGDSIRYQNEATTAFASISPQTLAKLKAELLNYEQGDGRAFVSDDTVRALLRDIRKGASFPAAHSEKSETHVKSPQQLPRSPLASAARAMRLPSPGDFSVTGKLMTRAIDARHPQQPPEESPKPTRAKYFGAPMPTHAHYFPYDRAEGLGMPGHHFPYDSGHQRKMTKMEKTVNSLEDLLKRSESRAEERARSGHQFLELLDYHNLVSSPELDRSNRQNGELYVHLARKQFFM